MAAPPGDLPSLYTAETFTVPGADIVSGSTVLAFKGLSDPISGINWNLDDASITAVSTPEPSTWALLVVAFACLGIRRQLKNSSLQIFPRTSVRAALLSAELAHLFEASVRGASVRCALEPSAFGFTRILRS